MTFNLDELTMIHWMLGTAIENNPGDEELRNLDRKVSDLLTDALDRLEAK